MKRMEPSDLDGHEVDQDLADWFESRGWDTRIWKEDGVFWADLLPRIGNHGPYVGKYGRSNSNARDALVNAKRRYAVEQEGES
jgi:hypothetical protein